MVICRKDGASSPSSAAPPTNGADARRFPQGGPVFLPPRRLSPLAEALLASPAESGVTPYDHLWFEGRPRA